MATAFSALLLQQSYQAVSEFLFLAVWGMALAPVIIRKMTSWTEKIAILLARVPTSDIMVITFGIAIGLVLANLLGGPFSHLPIIGPYIPAYFQRSAFHGRRQGSFTQASGYCGLF